jgi:hypothetical protein
MGSKILKKFILVWEMVVVKKLEDGFVTDVETE